jgi:hypothetical protein
MSSSNSRNSLLPPVMMAVLIVQARRRLPRKAKCSQHRCLLLHRVQPVHLAIGGSLRLTVLL